MQLEFDAVRVILIVVAVLGVSAANGGAGEVPLPSNIELNVTTEPAHAALGSQENGESREQQTQDLLDQKRRGCSQRALDAKVIAMLEPLLKNLAAQASMERSRGSRQPGDDFPWWTEWERVANEGSRELDVLGVNGSANADAALVFLLRLHFPSAAFDDDNVDWWLERRIRRVKPLVERMLHCIPLTGHEPFPQEMVLSMDRVRERIKQLPTAEHRNDGE